MGLYEEYRKDEQRCKTERIKYVAWLKETEAGDEDDDVDNDDAVLAELDTQLSLRDGDGLRDQNIMRNPGLSFKHISKNKWSDFLNQIAANFEMNIPSTKLSKT